MKKRNAGRRPDNAGGNALQQRSRNWRQAIGEQSFGDKIRVTPGGSKLTRAQGSERFGRADKREFGGGFKENDYRGSQIGPGGNFRGCNKKSASRESVPRRRETERNPKPTEFLSMTKHSNIGRARPAGLKDEITGADRHAVIGGDCQQQHVSGAGSSLVSGWWSRCLIAADDLLSTAHQARHCWSVDILLADRCVEGWGGSVRVEMQAFRPIHRRRVARGRSWRLRAGIGDREYGVRPFGKRIAPVCALVEILVTL